MGAIHMNLSLAEACKLAETLAAKSGHHCYFAGLLYDALEDAVYRLASPVEARFGERGELIIPLPTIDNFPWEVEPLTDTIEPEHITLLVNGPIIEDNIWEFRRPDEPSALGAPAIIDVDKHWPEWATAIRRQNEALSVEGLEAILAALGFAPPTASLMPSWKSGLYVLHLADGRLYVGQSINMAARLATHRRTYPDLLKVSLLKLRSNKAELDTREREAIQVLERRGFPLLNIVHASITHQSSPFDDLVSPDEQRAWLVNPSALTMGMRPPVDPDVRLKQAAKLLRLQGRPDAGRIIACLRHYVAMCLPRPAATEPAYWSVSCMPSTNAGWSPRIACFNSNTMEIFVVGHHKDDPSKLWAFLNISAVGFGEAFESDDQFQAAYPGSTVENVGYIAAGHDQVNISVQGLAQLEQLLRNPDILAAARLLNLHLMRKRTNFFARYHCYDLADLLLELSTTLTPA